MAQDFVLLFGEFWPRRLEFKHNGKIIRAADWPRIIAQAKRTNVRLTVDHRYGNSTISVLCEY